ncbi:MAG: hypothetical protein V1836_02190 [Candidatus Aenigmatarchaeota archaeon]
MKVWKKGVLVAFVLVLPLAVAAEAQRTSENSMGEYTERYMNNVPSENMNRMMSGGNRTYDHDVDDDNETDDEDQKPRMSFHGMGNGINGLVNGLGHVNMTSEKMGKMIANRLGFKNATVTTKTVDNATFYVVSGIDIRKANDRFLNKTFEAWFDVSTGKLISFDINMHATLIEDQ